MSIADGFNPDCNTQSKADSKGEGASSRRPGGSNSPGAGMGVNGDDVKLGLVLVGNDDCLQSLGASVVGQQSYRLWQFALVQLSRLA